MSGFGLMREHVLREADWLAIRASVVRQPFAVVDPGKDGAVVFALPEKSTTLRSTHELNGGLAGLAEQLAGRALLLVELPFMGLNVQSMLHTQRSGSHAVAYAAGRRSALGLNTDVVWIAPAVWQSFVNRELGSGGKQKKRGEGKKLSMRYARQRGFLPPSVRKELQQGMADAWCMADCLISEVWGFDD